MPSLLLLLLCLCLRRQVEDWPALREFVTQFCPFVFVQTIEWTSFDARGAYTNTPRSLALARARPKRVGPHETHGKLVCTSAPRPH